MLLQHLLDEPLVKPTPPPPVEIRGKVLGLANRPACPILPAHISTDGHFWNAFDNNQTEVSANWLVQFEQARVSAGGAPWSPFTYEEIDAFYNERRRNARAHDELRHAIRNSAPWEATKKAAEKLVAADFDRSALNKQEVSEIEQRLPYYWKGDKIAKLLRDMRKAMDERESFTFNRLIEPGSGVSARKEGLVQVWAGGGWIAQRVDDCCLGDGTGRLTRQPGEEKPVTVRPCEKAVAASAGSRYNAEPHMRYYYTTDFVARCYASSPVT
jgi:hypothetical protein